MAHEEAGKLSYTDCITLTCKVQRNVVKGWGESRTVLWLCCFHTPQRSCTTAPGEELELEGKDEMRKKVMDVFYALACFCVKERVSLSFVYCALSPQRFYSPSFHSVEC